MRTAIHSVTQLPSWIYQRYSQLWKRAVLAAGWALLYVLCDASVGAFPVQWRIVLAAFIVIGGLFRPVVAYAVFIAAVAYPLYVLSVYLMALAVAILILSAPVVASGFGRVRTRQEHRGAGLSLTLWVLVSPLLAPIHLAPMTPLLAGLWWGGTGGAVAGGLAALWLKLCAALSGASPDLWRIDGWSMTIEPIYERFHTANSLQTLIRLAEPLVSGSFEGASGSSAPSADMFLLFNLLQVCAWVAAGYVVGTLMDWLRADRHRGWKAGLSLGPGLVLVWAGYVAVPSWLEIGGPRWQDPLWLPAQVVLAGVVTWGVDGLVRYLRQPVTSDRQRARPSVFFPSRPRRHGRIVRWWGGGLRQRAAPDGQSREPLEVLNPCREDAKAASRSGTRDEEDIIMIELD